MNKKQKHKKREHKQARAAYIHNLNKLIHSIEIYNKNVYYLLIRSKDNIHRYYRGFYSASMFINDEYNYAHKITDIFCLYNYKQFNIKYTR